LRVRVSLLSLALAAVTVAAVAGLAPAGADSDGPAVGILVLKEHGVGSAAQAQPYLDRFVALAATQNDWSTATGRYHTNRGAAEVFIETEKPHYGILSLPAFLALRQKYRLEVIGQVVVTLVGGRQYSVISKRAADLAACKGKPLASDHADDAKFVDRVVAAGQFTLRDFTVIQTQRPLQTIKKVIGNEAECALIDDAQLAELSHLEGADGVRPIWQSQPLAPMVVVAFPSAPVDERAAFRENLGEVCDGNGQSICAEVGIVSLHAAAEADYAAVVAAYGR
jgi:hypothetical protein